MEELWVAMIGNQIGSIHIEDQLGAGGMGEVYLGWDSKLERQVAVKTIRLQDQGQEGFRLRFMREARLLSKLDHPSICRCYDLLSTADADFLIMEFVEGHTLRDLLPWQRPNNEILQLALHMAEALYAAHRKNIVHRDLKPENVMITRQGGVKILDFGVARALERAEDRITGQTDGKGASDEGVIPAARKTAQFAAQDQNATRDIHRTMALPFDQIPTIQPEGAASQTAALTREGSVVGTMAYMSPEQALGHPVTHACDMYSFGLILQEMFTGTSAYGAEGALELMQQVSLGQSVPFVSADGELNEFINQLKSPNPLERPTAFQAMQRLGRLLEKPRLERLRRLKTRALTLAIALTLITLAIVTTLALAAAKARKEAELRREQAEKLIGFMLEDLRPKLDAVGKLELLADINRETSAYFNDLDATRLSKAEKRFWVVTLQNMGDIQLRQGQLDQAEETILKAAPLAESLLTGKPPQDEDLQIVSDVYAWQGYLASFRPERLDLALELMDKSLALAKKLTARQPSNNEFRLQLANAHNNLGAICSQAGHKDQALHHLQASVDLFQLILGAIPSREEQLETLPKLASALGWASSLQEESGHLAQALALRRQNIHALERVISLERENRIWQADAAVSYRYLALQCIHSGLLQEAAKAFNQGLEVGSSLLAAEPKQVEWQRSLALLLANRGWFLVRMNGRSEGWQNLQQAGEMLERLMQVAPGTEDWRRFRAMTYLLRARLSPLNSEERLMLPELCRSLLGPWDPKAEFSQPTFPLWMECWLLVAESTASRQGEQARAELAAIPKPNVAPKDPWLLWLFTRKARLEGDETAQKSGCQTLNKLGFRHPDFLSWQAANGP
jgi:serine/threonine protein kinase